MRALIAKICLLGSILLALVVLPSTTLAQPHLDSTNYRLLDPTVGNYVAGTSDSANYSQHLSPSLDGFTTTSTNYELSGGFSRLILANVPQASCFETSTIGGTTSCTGLPGSDGMQGVCSEPGCYDRAKLEIDAQGNANDTRYAIQISTTSDFSSNIFHVDGTTRFLKGSLTINDFIPKCEWEGTIVSGICGSANTTWQRYNILGLDPSTTYYARLAAHKGTSTSGTYTQTEWGPSSSAATQAPTITLDVDIAPNTSTPSSPPYIVDIGTMVPTTVKTATNMIVFRLTTNALNGIETKIRGDKGELEHSSTTTEILAVNADLSSAASGYGLRNNSATNSAQNTGTLGNITVSSSPSDFTETGGADKVGAPTTTLVDLFNSANAPLDTGISAYWVKAKADLEDLSGSYSEIITFIVKGVF